ncbi:M6 family metalloprotease domain-containing protein [Heliobacterium mobile]|uniref:M6 family metalloprotease domain-containing protein n=1 Tax=Heliobacterium mobile TaxID=28064 RepID=UPI0014795889|nr:M6 family metalloprotease domain-containing protein [Heliobacterium mobile]
MLKRRRSIYLWMCLFILLWPAIPASAMQPPSTSMIEKYKADGSYAKRVERARNIGDHKPSSAMMQKLRVKAERLYWKAKGLSDAEIRSRMKSYDTPSSWQGGLPAIGSPRVPVLLVDFPDYPQADKTGSRNDIAKKMFGNGDPSLYPYDSLHNYYQRSSYNKLDLQGDVMQWYTAKHQRSYYEQFDSMEPLIEEIFDYYTSQGIDFSKYDNDGDGVLDAFYVKWTGPDNGWSGFWWPYMTNWRDASFEVNGKKLNTYVASWYSNLENDGSEQYVPLTDIHETGHLMGLPDYYDYDSTKGPSGGVGGLDMMDYNWGDHNAFSKFVLGWLDPVVVPSGEQTITLRPTSLYPDAAVIMPGAKDEPFGGEFYMVQYRKQSTGNDTKSLQKPDIPASGMLIWHVDTRLDSSGETIYDNSYTSHKLLRLMEADGLEEIEQDALADAGDFYVTSEMFGPDTKPNSRSYTNQNTGVRVDDFGLSGTTMSARFSIITASDTSSLHIAIADPDSGNKPDGVAMIAYHKFLTLKANVTDDNGNTVKGAKVRWKTDDPTQTIVKMDANTGRIYSVQEGKVTFTAQVLDGVGDVLAVSDPLTVTFYNPNRPARIEIVDPDKGASDGMYRLNQKKSVTLKTKVYNAAGKTLSSSRVRWFSEETGTVIQLDSRTGKVKGMSPGTAYVYAYIPDGNGEVLVNSEPLQINVK